MAEIYEANKSKNANSTFDGNLRFLKSLKQNLNSVKNHLKLTGNI